MPGDVDISDAAVLKATGQTWRAWFEVLDPLGLELNHTQRAKGLQAAAPQLDGWWVQMITVQFERERGLREIGESSTGGFQISASKTLPVDLDAAWEHVLATPFLPGAAWQEGHIFATPEAEIEVRRVNPGKMLRFWWHGNKRSTVEVDFIDKGNRCSVRFSQFQMASPQEGEAARKRWQQALIMIEQRISEQD